MGPKSKAYMPLYFNKALDLGKSAKFLNKWHLGYHKPTSLHQYDIGHYSFFKYNLYLIVFEEKVMEVFLFAWPVQL